MFSKTSLQSFVYNMIDVFNYPEEEEVKKMFQKYKVKTCQLYQNLTDTDSTSLTFAFLCDRSLEITENDSRKIIFEIMVTSKILSRLDLSDHFWNQFGVQNKALIKQGGLYEVESIDNPNISTISDNPKEYFEKYRDKGINKKHKGL